jgi:hypothetical protein
MTSAVRRFSQSFSDEGGANHILLSSRLVCCKVARVLLERVLLEQESRPGNLAWEFHRGAT